MTAFVCLAAGKWLYIVFMAAVFPTGTVTFLFTDIEGSTKLWEEHPEQMRLALARHDALLRDAVVSHGGTIFKSTGDGCAAAFPTAPDALLAVLAAQQALAHEAWPESVQIRVRMALHTGAAELRDGDYFGPPLNRAARLLSAAHGGQVLLSEATQELTRDTLPTGASLKSLGEHRLRDLARPEQVFQLLHPDLPANFPPLRSLDNPQMPNNLPQQVTSFIGREKEMAEVKALLKETRLLTLTGSGGCGKSRLSLQVAADVLEEYAGGVWLVELAPLADPALVPQAVASVLGVKEEAGKSLIESLSDALKPKNLIVVLDNCEHLLEACARLVEALGRSCPHVKVLASSREGLGVPGEQTYRVPSLSLPDPKQKETPESLSQYEAVRLFIERARLAQPEFTVTNQNTPALAQVCYRLDGIPLALELAAARVRSLSVEEINTRLDNRFRLLTGGSRTALPRQQTLRALIDWSYDLLTEPEKILLRRLSVFSGGWSLEAAEQVCAGEDPSGGTIEDWEVLDLLTGLVDKSLALAETQEGHTRYRLLETVRQYARDRLLESGEGEAVRDRHRDYFVAFSEKALQFFNGPQQAFWYAQLDPEHDNLRAVLEWCQSEEEGAQQAGLRLGAALWRFWNVRGRAREGLQWLQEILERDGAKEPTEQRANALNGAGVLAVILHECAAAHRFLDESLLIWRYLGSTEVIHTLQSLGYLALVEGKLTEAQALYEESLQIAQSAGKRRFTLYPLQGLGRVAHSRGDLLKARACYEESVSVAREFGDHSGLIWALDSLAQLMSELGDADAARVLQEENRAIAQQLQSPRVLAETLSHLGYQALIRGQYAQARSLYQQRLEAAKQADNEEQLGWAYFGLGVLAQYEGDYARAQPLFEEALRLFHQAGVEFAWAQADIAWYASWHRSQDARALRSTLEKALAHLQAIDHATAVPWIQCHLAWVVQEEGDLSLAGTLLREALSSRSRFREQERIIWCLIGLARVLRAQGRVEQTIRLRGALESVLERVGFVLPLALQEEQEQVTAETRSLAGSEAAERLRDEGRLMTQEEAITSALAAVG